MNINALVILAEGHEEVEAITPIDLMRRAGINVITAGIDKREVAGAHGITTIADTTIENLTQNFDAIILPGGMPGTLNLCNSQKVLDIIKDINSKPSNLCAAICAAPLVLSKAGILNGKKFTCYPGTEDKIPEGRKKEENVVIDGNIITSKGVGTAIDFSLAIVEYLVDTYAADILSNKIIYNTKD